MSNAILYQKSPFSDPAYRHDVMFLSPYRSLWARGLNWQLRLILQREERNSLPHFLQTSLQLAAQTLHLDDPIIIGAIPFDKSQPASLIIPKQYQWLSQRPDFVIPHSPSLTLCQQHYLPNKALYCRTVQQIKSQIDHQKIAKVVLARQLSLTFSDTLDSWSIFQALQQQNPDSYNFHLPLATGTLVGASPELLLRKIGSSILSQPLAGTCSRHPNLLEDQRQQQRLLQSTKDRQEHQFVITMLKETLSPHCDLLTIPSTPTLFKTPLLWHLASTIKGHWLKTNENALAVAALLHPTPALAGLPTESAIELIKQVETTERHYFGGIVGWCDAHGNGEWVVNIRSGFIQQKHIQLFAGAGIVADSQPELEWQETRAKFGTLLRALQLNDSMEAVA